MGYDLQAVIGRRDMLDRHHSRYRSAQVVLLRQGFAMIPLTEAVMSEVGFGGPISTDMAVPGFYLPKPIAAWAEGMSLDGAVAYLESSCHGGDCSRGAIVWDNGQIVLGPFPVEPDPRAPWLDRVALVELHRRDRAAWTAAVRSRFEALTTNQALRWIGVDRMEAVDELDAIGLSARLSPHRFTDEWATAGR